MKRIRLRFILFSLLFIIITLSIALVKNQHNPAIPIKELTVVEQLSKDMARYHPGQQVEFHARLRNSKEDKTHLKVQYYHLDKIIDEEIIMVEGKSLDWSWTPPAKDYRGYFVKVFPVGNEKESQSIAIDVSSTWTKFPRYGILSDFSEMSKNRKESVLNQLKRYHINGLQFYDWHDEHHLPLKMTDGNVQKNWANIANQPVSFQTLKDYINLSHDRNIETMAYNLLNGSLEKAEDDGVLPEWYLYKDQNSDEVDTHDLPDQWKSDIFLTDPGNEAWQQYIILQQKIVFNHLPFDGWHIDQLGDRGEVYNFYGESVDLEIAYFDFLKTVHNQLPNQTIIMNAVNQYGQVQISKTGAPFLYTEVWNPTKTYKQLKDILEENAENHGKSTVLAAYMNYNKSDNEGSFNTAGILYTDALIFAHGGGHLELGEHMLSKEYFPHNKLIMSERLKSSLTHYYDFMVGYQNLLRDNLEPAEVDAQTSEWVSLSHQPKQGSVYTFAKQKGEKKIFHFLNYNDTDHMNWRDTNGTQTQPKMRKDFSLTVKESKKVKKVWAASPDWNNGVPIELEFTQSNDKVQFTIPYIKYWDMVVFEYE
ncbi:glycoside hydrolase family 66 protein [Halobacillus sp. BBL2006]|uniref:glycoside hydrolase family 66 protein n=1 Tax=Halobacillus sp. BBL2006 TaxID=1543706 RepID=UPI000690D7B8|nr:glycoside hydrolase family 66 protein [Halobacillus sp. BBL2006]